LVLVSPLTTPQFIPSNVQRRFSLLVCVVWIKGSTRGLGWELVKKLYGAWGLLRFCTLLGVTFVT
jgi:hypothetical protein